MTTHCITVTSKVTGNRVTFVVPGDATDEQVDTAALAAIQIDAAREAQRLDGAK